MTILTKRRFMLRAAGGIAAGLRSKRNTSGRTT